MQISDSEFRFDFSDPPFFFECFKFSKLGANGSAKKFFKNLPAVMFRNETSRTQFVGNFDRCVRNAHLGCALRREGTFADDHAGLRRISPMLFVGQVRCGSGRRG